MFYVAGGAFRGGGALDGFFEDDGDSASRSLSCPVLCSGIGGDCRVRDGANERVSQV